MYSNSIVAYLIKDRYASFESIIELGEHAASIQSIEMELEGAEAAHFYYRGSFRTQPDWLNKFFGNSLDEDVKGRIFSSNAQAVLLIKASVSDGHRFFAVSYGTGRFLLKDEAIEKNFGLRTVLNLTEVSQIRHLDKKVISSNPKQTREQIAKPGQTSEFGVDIDRDILKGITGTSKEVLFGKSISGSDAFKASVKQDVFTIGQWFSSLYEHYRSDHYKTAFSWIDLVSEVKDARVVEKLDNALLALINDGTYEDVTMAVPEVIDWEKVQGCKYSSRKKGDFAPGEIELQAFLEVNNPYGEAMDLDFLKSKRITAQNSDGKIEYNWPSYRCMVAEIILNDHSYLLSDATWYQIDVDFKREVDDYFTNEVKTSNLNWVNYSGQREDAYNKALSEQLDAACMDKMNVHYGGGHSSIEVCDILTKDKQLIHIKKYAGSAPLSHLFSQGLVSSQLLLGDKAFRQSAKNKIENGKKGLLSINDYKSSEWTVVFAILGRKDRKLPFFSKVTLRQVARDLTARGYTVQLDFIPKTDS